MAARWQNRVVFVGVCGQPKRDGLQRGAAAGAGGKNKSAESLQAAGLNPAVESSGGRRRHGVSTLFVCWG